MCCVVSAGEEGMVAFLSCWVVVGEFMQVYEIICVFFYVKDVLGLCLWRLFEAGMSW